jgi:hypothetical protein
MDDRKRSSLKEALFETVQGQIDNGSPPETKETYEKLLLTGHTREQALRLIASVMLAEMNMVMQSRKPYSEERYVKALQKLP